MSNTVHVARRAGPVAIRCLWRILTQRRQHYPFDIFGSELAPPSLVVNQVAPDAVSERCSAQASCYSSREWEQVVVAIKKRKAQGPEGTLEPRAIEPSSGHDAPGCPVVGIGASAGGPGLGGSRSAFVSLRTTHWLTARCRTRGGKRANSSSKSASPPSPCGNPWR
jgi:hypothetical protein